jgi:prepilin-type N-terminal cleavage/methylation domain-containing protein
MKRRDAFTLIELFMVVSIIAVLIALLLPAVQSSRESARRTQCTNNLLQLGIGLANYASTHHVFPPGVVNDKGPVLNLPTGYHHGWIVQILPFIDQNNVYRRFDLRRSVYHPANMTARDAVIATFLCPSDPGRSATNYAGCHHDVEAPIDANNHGVLFLNSRIGYDDIIDGPAYTILLGEMVKTGPTLGWAAGTRATLRNTGRRINEPDVLLPVSRNPPGAFFIPSGERSSPEAIQKLVDDGLLPIDYSGGFGSHHPGGANMLFCNGAVRFVKVSINSVVYERLGNRSDGEIVGDDHF